LSSFHEKTAEIVKNGKTHQQCISPVQSTPGIGVVLLDRVLAPPTYFLSIHPRSKAVGAFWTTSKNIAIFTILLEKS
jgi:hypothetical protein